MSLLKADVKNRLDEYEPGESSYRALYEPLFSKTVDEWAELDLDELTRLLQISWDYLYGSIGVVNRQGDPRWLMDRKHLVEAEQRAFQRRLCQARRQRVRTLLDAGTTLGGKLPDSYLAAAQEIQRLTERRHAYEAIVQAPFAYPQEARGLIHDVIVVLYEGKQEGAVIHFPLGEGVDSAPLERSIKVAKDAAFEYYNQHKKQQKQLDPADYSIRIYIDDYPGGMVTQSFSGKSFTLAVSVGVLACLMKREIPSTIAFSAEVGTIDGQLLPIDYDKLKAKAECLSGITQLVVCAKTKEKELEAWEGVLEAQRIQVREARKRPDQTDIISVESLTDAWAQISTNQDSMSPPLSERLEELWQVLVQLKPVLKTLAVVAGILLICGFLWFHFDKPVLTAHGFQVRPPEVTVRSDEAGQTRKLDVYASFQSRFFTSQWLKIASGLYGRSYYIECPDNVTPAVLPINSANFHTPVQYTVPRSNQTMRFELKNREGYLIVPDDVTVKVIPTFPAGGKQ